MPYLAHQSCLVLIFSILPRHLQAALELPKFVTARLFFFTFQLVEFLKLKGFEMAPHGIGCMLDNLNAAHVALAA
jgi:hypothetical protein